MSFRARVARGAAVLGGGQVVGYAFSFLRNVIIARVVGVEHFGIASTFAISVTLLEMVSDFAMDKMLIQSPDGDATECQSMVHLLQFLRGCVIGLILFSTGGLFARAFGIPETAWAFRTLAVVPLIRGLSHFDISRFQRNMSFLPIAIVELVPQAISAVAAWPLALWIGDYTVMLWIVIFQTLQRVVLSHIVAQRRYAWKWETQWALRLMHFGWPLLLNGVVLFLAVQGDRAVVATVLSMETLGVYAATAAMLMVPAMIIFKVIGQVGLPVMASVQLKSDDFRRRYGVAADMIAAISAMSMVPFILGGPWIVSAVFGAQFRPATSFVSILACAQMIRAFRVLPTLTALSKGDSRTILFANTVRAGFVIPLAGAALVYGSLTAIAIVALLGECVALFVALQRMCTIHGLRHSVALLPFAIALAVPVVSCVIVLSDGPVTGIVSLSVIALLAATGVLALMAACRAGFRRELWRAASSGRKYLEGVRVFKLLRP